MNPRALSRFRVGGFDDEAACDREDTEPVRVTCARCRTKSPWLTFRDDGGADRTAPLDELVVWAQEHRCPVVRTAERDAELAARLDAIRAEAERRAALAPAGQGGSHG